MSLYEYCLLRLPFFIIIEKIYACRRTGQYRYLYIREQLKKKKKMLNANQSFHNCLFLLSITFERSLKEVTDENKWCPKCPECPE